MYLTERYLIFSKGDKSDSTKRWEIVIPLASIILEQCGIEEQSRRKQIYGATSNFEGFSVGSGLIHQTGKEHHLVVPYIDENGIPQEPRFGISSFRGKAIREWASKLYEHVVKEKSNSIHASPITQYNNEIQPANQQHATQSSDDPLKILKTRFAKGEISKEEYEEMRRILES